jgi:hypothetical protein
VVVRWREGGWVSEDTTIEAGDQSPFVSTLDSSLSDQHGAS